ncbi:MULTISPECIES: BPSS1780 family membrane protein [Ramlibacter]|uniref:DUF2189 domain-containing protein n=1 Tax=Ramlibacter pinisoli TaxID=2682844 RepID=A0A6N8IXI0_9BURK|nr:MULTISPECIES: BPSS1780 family membrane protein [Ramlibacter]MBA2961614.1 hypothetical protein [Ramlibacter sp. CGMCC 1.13660]MVQ31557.1 hypothetical protein [Ramlibacter pinisoli]
MKLNVVPARTGISWVKLGIRTFLRQPLALAGLFFMYMAVVLVISFVPVIGPLVGGMLVPAATLGLMAATAEASAGKFPMPTVLVSAFRAGRQRARSMLVLGLVYASGSLLATWLGSQFADPAPLSAATDPRVDVSTLVTLVLHTPLFLMFWHAPALVHWHGVTPAKSLFFSTVACWRNMGALTVYSLVWMGVFLLAGIVITLIGGLAGGASAARAVMMPAALLMAAMFSTSIWFTFRDSFSADPQPDAAPGPASPATDEDLR